MEARCALPDPRCSRNSLDQATNTCLDAGPYDLNSEPCLHRDPLTDTWSREVTSIDPDTGQQQVLQVTLAATLSSATD